MKNKRVFILMFLSLIFTCAVFFTGIGEEILTTLVRWAEIVVVFSFMAGVAKFLKNQFLSALPDKKESSPIVKKEKFFWFKKNEKRINSLIILISFAATFFITIFNLNQTKYTFNNIVREQPGFITFVSETLIEEDPYLSKFPARKKLAFYLSSKVSPYFFPTDEMLNEVSTSAEQYKTMLYDNMLSIEQNIAFLNSDDAKLAAKMVEKVKETSIKAIDEMTPVANDLKNWFGNSLNAVSSKKIKNSEDLFFDDLIVDNVKAEGTGLILKEWLLKTYKSQEIEPIKRAEISYSYANFILNSQITQNVAEAFFKKEISPSSEALKKISAAFLKTGVTTSPRLKGFIRWIYRTVFAPLLASFISLLFFSMIITVYKKFSFRKYSYFVITAAFCLTLLTFIPNYNLMVRNRVPLNWRGPFSDDWLMRVFSAPVFKALAIGTAAGFLFFIFEKFYSAFIASFWDKK